MYGRVLLFIKPSSIPLICLLNCCSCGMFKNIPVAQGEIYCIEQYLQLGFTAAPGLPGGGCGQIGFCLALSGVPTAAVSELVRPDHCGPCLRARSMP